MCLRQYACGRFLFLVFAGAAQGFCPVVGPYCLIASFLLASLRGKKKKQNHNTEPELNPIRELLSLNKKKFLAYLVKPDYQK